MISFQPLAFASLFCFFELYALLRHRLDNLFQKRPHISIIAFMSESSEAVKYLKQLTKLIASLV